MRNTGTISWKSWPLALMLAAVPIVVRAQVGATATVRIIEGIPHPALMAAGDLNADGKLDLAIVEQTIPKGVSQEKARIRLHLLYQKANGFALPPDKTIDLRAQPGGLVLGDFDNDKKNDLAVGMRSIRTLSLYLGGEGFAKEHRSAYNNDSGGGFLSWGHLNRDGLADFVTSAAWRKWLGGDNFRAVYISGPRQNDNYRSILADMDRNGTDDIIFTTYAGSQNKGNNNCLRIYYGPLFGAKIIGPEAAAETVTLTSPFSDSDKMALGIMLVGDLNGDEQPDIVVGGPDQTLVYFQDNPTGFTGMAGPSLVLQGVTPLLAEDLDGDRLCDLVLRHVNGKSIFIWRQGKPLTANCLAESREVTLGKTAGAVAAGDMQGNGTKEIFVALQGGGLAIVSPTAPMSVTQSTPE